MKDVAENYYEEKNSDLDLTHELDTYGLWAFGISFVLFLGLIFPSISIYLILAPFISIILGTISLYRGKMHSRFKGKIFAKIGVMSGVLQILIAYMIVVLHFLM